MLYGHCDAFLLFHFFHENDSIRLLLVKRHRIEQDLDVKFWKQNVETAPLNDDYRIQGHSWF